MKEPQDPAQACVIWMHGLGADAADMMGLADQLPVSSTPVRHVFIDAPSRPVTLNGGMVMPAWYDIMGMELVDREDKAGIEKSRILITQVMNTQLEDGFKSEQIFLAGFSQGGAMAIHTALHFEGKLGGVIALSAYIPLASQTDAVLDKSTPFFIGSGQYDPLVLPIWTQQSHQWLKAQGYQHLSIHLYSMEHSICYEEVRDVSEWLNQQVQGVSQ
ncbi:MAG: alpha/beta hydrolase-fold protein [Legionella sp.]|nr:alpha/beta hydrolase-fold protein [Legionella sp.]